jgi:hypothetical protein
MRVESTGEQATADVIGLTGSVGQPVDTARAANRGDHFVAAEFPVVGARPPDDRSDHDRREAGGRDLREEGVPTTSTTPSATAAAAQRRVAAHQGALRLQRRGGLANQFNRNQLRRTRNHVTGGGLKYQEQFIWKAPGTTLESIQRMRLAKVA